MGSSVTTSHASPNTCRYCHFSASARAGPLRHRVRRDPLNTQVLQELLSRADRTMITAQHRP